MPDTITLIRQNQLADTKTCPGQILLWMISLAEQHWHCGHTQIAADTLAFVRSRTDLPEDVRDRAEALYAEMESRICPRVLLDAREFAAEMDVQTMIEYLLEAI